MTTVLDIKMDALYTMTVYDEHGRAMIVAVKESADECKEWVQRQMAAWLTLSRPFRAEQFSTFAAWNYRIERMKAIVEQGRLGDLPLMAEEQRR